MLYKYAALPEDTEPEKRTFTTINDDGMITESDAARSFFIDKITQDGTSELFAKPITKVSELTEEVLTLVMPKILFQVRNPKDLEGFVELFAAHLGVCNLVPELNLEIDFTWSMEEDHTAELGKLEEITVPHGRGFMSKYVEEWLSMLAMFPDSESIQIHLVFSKIWRDFRELRGLCKKFGISNRTVTFQFSDQDAHFYKAQTMAAVKDVETEEQINISVKRREELVNLGCRGFNQVRRSLNA
ncbi:hypothetical protein ONS96_009433 [Cadophora gregata f. sp. sojae]|nr:hypothetical protein ONS96_009433 [Cadophora gregata f. sp. sojae]